MTNSPLFARARVALARPRLGVALLSSCAITAAVAGPMAYQATHFHPPTQSADAGQVQIVEPAGHHRPTHPSTTATSSSSSTSTSTTTDADQTTSTGQTTTSSSAPRSGTSTTQPATTTTGAPVRLHTQISPAGSLVASHRGAEAVQVTSDGGSLAHVHLMISATGATPVAAPNDGWSCTGAATLSCDAQDTLNPASPATVFVALDVSGSASSVSVTATATAAGASSSADATATSRADVTSGFSARFAGVVRGDVTTVGNTLSTCPPGATAGTATCEQAQARDGSVTTGQNNNDWSMIAVDADNDSATSNSSAADLSTAGSDVVSASLYWSGGQTAGFGGSAASGPIGSALLATPATTGGSPAGAASYVPISAGQVEQVGSTYQAYADVTALVQAGGAGRYWVGGVAAATGDNTQSGWTLTVVYRQAGATPRTILIFDGLVQVADGTQTLQASGFRVDPSTSARLGLVAYEGDWGLGTDTVSCGSSSQLSDGTRDAGNFFNSSITRTGSIDSSGTPSLPNTFGLDIADLDVSPSVVPGCLTPGSSSTSLQFSTAMDQYLVGVVTLSADR